MACTNLKLKGSKKGRKGCLVASCYKRMAPEAISVGRVRKFGLFVIVKWFGCDLRDGC